MNIFAFFSNLKELARVIPLEIGGILSNERYIKNCPDKDRIYDVLQEELHGTDHLPVFEAIIRWQMRRVYKHD